MSVFYFSLSLHFCSCFFLRRGHYPRDFIKIHYYPIRIREIGEFSNAICVAIIAGIWIQIESDVMWYEDIFFLPLQRITLDENGDVTRDSRRERSLEVSRRRRTGRRLVFLKGWCTLRRCTGDTGQAPTKCWSRSIVYHCLSR